MKLKSLIQSICLFLIVLNIYGILIAFPDNFLLHEERVIFTIIFSNIILLSLLAFVLTFTKVNQKLSSFLMGLIISLDVGLIVYSSYYHEMVWGTLEITIVIIFTLIFTINNGILFFLLELSNSKKDRYKTKIKNFLIMIDSWIALFWVYLPIIAGILTPMIWFFPIAYFSWELFEIISRNTYFNTWFPLSNQLKLNILIIECIMFIVGLLLFLIGVIYLIKARRSNIGIAQTGPYKFIRHPQNLGILIISLSFVFYVPWFGDLGIRIADLFSWCLFIIIIVIISDLEEYKMVKKYPEQYYDYISHTGYFFPQIINWQKKVKIKNKKYYLKRYSILLITFVLIVIFTSLIAEILYKNGILVMTR